MVTVRTGETVRVSGIYQVQGSSYQIILSTGDRVPPYNGRAVSYVLVQQPVHRK
jgi:hypothetical protein